LKSPVASQGQNYLNILKLISACWFYFACSSLIIDNIDIMTSEHKLPKRIHLYAYINWKKKSEEKDRDIPQIFNNTLFSA
jgi:hypothetical protein